MPSCAAPHCLNRQSGSSEKTFHLFPYSRPELLELWIENMGREYWTPSRRSVLCSEHFAEDCFDMTGCTTRLKSDAVPTIFYSRRRKKKATDESDKRQMIQSKRSLAVKQPSDLKEEEEEEATEQSQLSSSFGSRYSKRKRTKPMDPDFVYGGNLSKKLKENVPKEENTMVTEVTRIDFDSVPRLMPSDRITHRGNDSVFLEFAEPKKEVILEMNSLSQNARLLCYSIFDLLKLFKEKDLLVRELEELMQLYGDIDSNLIRIKSKRDMQEPCSYSEKVKKFSTLLLLSSSEAYDIASTVFMLPDKCSLRYRLLVEDYWPGFTKEAMRMFKNHSFRKPQERLCSIMFDFVPLKRECSLDHSGNKWIGHVDYGKGQDPSEGDSIPLASDVLVFTAVGLVSDWKMPFAYFMVGSEASSELLKNLITEAILMLEIYGLRVRALVCSTSVKNVRLAKNLGCNVQSTTMNNMVTSFRHPTNPEKEIHFVFDVHQTLYMLQNLIANKDSLHCSGEGEIKWEYIDHILQDTERKKPSSASGAVFHKFYHLKTLAKRCDLIFNSAVSASLQMSELFQPEDYAQRRGTANIIENIQKSLSILHARNPFLSKGRQAIFKHILAEQVESLMEIAQQILSLELSPGKRLAADRRWMAVVLYPFSLKSIMQLATQMLEDDAIKYFCPYRISLDHWDMLVNHLYRGGCWRREPSPSEFRNAYKCFFVRYPRNYVMRHDFDGQDITVNQGKINFLRNSFHHCLDRKKNFNSQLSYAFGDSMKDLNFHSPILDMKTEEIHRGNCIVEMVTHRISCLDCISILIDNGFLSGMENQCTNREHIQPSGFLIKLLRYSEALLKVELRRSSSSNLEKFVIIICREYLEQFGLPELAISHSKEDPWHVICLVKVIVRTLVSQKLSKQREMRNRFQILLQY